MIKKKLILGALVAGLAISQAGTAFAGAWKQDSAGWWYQNDDNTYKKDGWFQDSDGSWYYFNTAGYAYTGCWQAINGAWYYFDANGRMLANKWEWIDGNKDGTAECYNFSPSGAAYMYMTTPDGYVVDINGAWTVDGTIQTKKVSVGPGGTGATTTKTSFSGGSSGGSGGGGGSSSGGGGSSSTTKSYYNDFKMGNLSAMTSSQWKETKAAIESFKSTHITEDMSDFEKEMEIIKWLCENCEYELADDWSRATAYSCIMLGKAQCSGYADAFLQTAKLCGLNVRYDHSSNHAWNLIELDGDWYIVDVTNADAISSKTFDYKYINRNGEQADSLYIAYSEYLKSSSIKVNGTKYGPNAVAEYLGIRTDYSKENYEKELPAFYEAVKNIEADYTIKTDDYTNIYDQDKSDLCKELAKELEEIKGKGSGTYTFVFFSDYELEKDCGDKCNASTGKGNLVDMALNILGSKKVDGKIVRYYTTTDCTKDYSIHVPSYVDDSGSHEADFIVVKLTYTAPDTVTNQTANNSDKDVVVEDIVDNTDNSTENIIEDAANNSNDNTENTVESTISEDNSVENTEERTENNKTEDVIENEDTAVSEQTDAGNSTEAAENVQ